MALFSHRPTAVWLEIGFGNGEHLAEQARRHPEIGFIGSEVFVNGVAALLRHIEWLGLTNVRIFDDDARLLLTSLPEASIARAFLLFPDPWPKARHAKRRFVGRANLAILANLLADGAELRIATDDPGYARWTLRQLSDRTEFSWLARKPSDWRDPPADWVETRYQRKAVAAGRRPVFLRFERRPRHPIPENPCE
jgi:tRNA (guanine-N7-)-methyltransferase